MFDNIWVKTGLDSDEIISDFKYHKVVNTPRIAEVRDASWRRLAKKIQKWWNIFSQSEKCAKAFEIH